MHTNEVCFHTQQPTHARDTLTYGPLFWTVWAEHQSSIEQKFLSFALIEHIWMAAGCSSLLKHIEVLRFDLQLNCSVKRTFNTDR